MALSEKDKYQRVLHMQSVTQFIRFKGATLYRTKQGFERASEEAFARLAYQEFPGMSGTNVKDIYREVCATAPDWTPKRHLIGLRDVVWDTVALELAPDELDFVYSSGYAPATDSRHTAAARAYLLELAAGDSALADDYLQAMAPLFMSQRPAGVVWFTGDGANGKSSLIKALYKLLGRHFESLTVADIEDGRAAPALRGVLGNICRESSEGRVEDTERYKAIGTHEPFTVRQMRTHDMITVDGDFHTIFNANNIPVFADKTKGARRRTLIVPFPAHFEDDPTFDERTFTDNFLSGLLALILEATHVIRDNGYAYRWSDATLRAKESYDSEVNSAEAFVNHLLDSKVVGFSNYHMLRVNYENWCGLNGFVPLGVTTLKRTINTMMGPERRPLRVEGRPSQRYICHEAPRDIADIIWLDNGYGMASDKQVVETTVQEVLNDEW